VWARTSTPPPLTFFPRLKFPFLTNRSLRQLLAASAQPNPRRSHDIRELVVVDVVVPV